MSAGSGSEQARDGGGMAQVDEAFLPPKQVPVVTVGGGRCFNKLSEREKKYATALSLAAWAGSKITLTQVSDTSPKILKFLQLLFCCGAKNLSEHAGSILGNSEEVSQLLQYCAWFLYQHGNFTGFGDKKFIPRLPREKFQFLVEQLVVGSGSLGGKYTDSLKQTFDEIVEDMYSLPEDKVSLGLPGIGLTEYYHGLAQDQIKEITEIQQKAKIGFENTMVKRIDKNTIGIFAASIDDFEQEVKGSLSSGERVVFKGGLFKEELKTVVFWLHEAKKWCANEREEQMLNHLIEHYRKGELSEHLAYSADWVQDKHPTVETYIGFIETYRDPMGVRAEYESFVAIQDPDSTEELKRLVAASDTILPLLPWPHEFEADSFRAPSYTGINVIAFPTTGLPIGINIPNYEEIRRGTGYKNVTLQNVVLASNVSENPTFVSPEHFEAFKRMSTRCCEIHTALHELYGHGSGRQFNPSYARELAERGVINPATNDVVSPDDCYKEGESYNSIFGAMSSPWEECRAEAVSLYLSGFKEVMDIFAIPQEDREDFLLVAVIDFLKAGIGSLVEYDSKNCRWLQAHCQARFAILRTLLVDAPTATKLIGEGINTRIWVDMSKFKTHIMPALARFITRLTCYKATANFSAANELFSSLTAVDEKFLRLRAAAIELKKPRRAYQQPQIIKQLDGSWSMIDTEPSTINFIDIVLNNISLAQTATK